VYQLIADRRVAGETVVVAQAWLFGARIAQEELGVPLATVYLQPLLFGSVYDTPSLPRWTPRWVPGLMNRLVERSVDWGLAPAIDAFRAELGLPPVRCPVLRWWRYNHAEKCHDRVTPGETSRRDADLHRPPSGSSAHLSAGAGVLPPRHSRQGGRHCF